MSALDTFIHTITDRSNEVIKEMHQKVLKGLESCGQTAEKYAKSDCPVDTGTLRNSISHSVVKETYSAYIGTNVEYAPYVEYGDYNHTSGKKYFLRDAASTHTEEYKEILKSSLKS